MFKIGQKVKVFAGESNASYTYEGQIGTITSLSKKGDIGTLDIEVPEYVDGVSLGIGGFWTKEWQLYHTVKIRRKRA